MERFCNVKEPETYEQSTIKLDKSQPCPNYKGENRLVRIVRFTSYVQRSTIDCCTSWVWTLTSPWFLRTELRRRSIEISWLLAQHSLLTCSPVVRNRYRKDDMTWPYRFRCWRQYWSSCTTAAPMTLRAVQRMCCMLAADEYPMEDLKKVCETTLWGVWRLEVQCKGNGSAGREAGPETSEGRRPPLRKEIKLCLMLWLMHALRVFWSSFVLTLQNLNVWTLPQKTQFSSIWMYAFL